MERSDIIQQLKIDFGYTIKSFVSKEYYISKGESAWDSLDSNILETFLIICQNSDKPIVVNNWFMYADSEYNKDYVFKYRGFRNFNEYLKSSKLSQHRAGKAIDFHIVGQNPIDSRAWIRIIADKLPYNIRMEKGVNWVHIDVGTRTNSGNVSKLNSSGRKSVDNGITYVKKIFKNLRDNFGFKEIIIED